MNTVGSSIPRIESLDKVTGSAKYNDDYVSPTMLHARLVTSPYAHAKITSIDISEALASPGVQAVLTGEYYPRLYGQLLEDRPPLALGKVRHFGEPVAMVVANSEYEAAAAANLVKVTYHPLPAVNSISDALQQNATLVHEDLGLYGHYVAGVRPEPGTNIAHKAKIRKGDVALGWAESEVIVTSKISLPQSDHAAMETRSARVEIKQDGRVYVYTPTQGPHFIQKIMAHFFNLDTGKVIVVTDLVGGAYGGKTTAQLELLAYMASHAVGGQMVKIANTREEDIMSSPGHIGVEAEIKLGATKAGMLKAAEITYLITCGAYTDSSPTMAKAMAAVCTGPYNIPHVWCDSVLVYTNHPFVTAFRGFGHLEMTFAVERAIDKLAHTLNMDSAQLRLQNAIVAGSSSPTQELLTVSNLGNVPECVQKAKDLIKWDEGQRIETPGGKIRAKGLACFWKTSSSPVNAISGAILTMNKDGSVTLNCGVVEIGQGTKTALAQLLADNLSIDLSKVHVVMEVKTDVSPEHWKTVASKSLYMAGRAVLRAAEDLKTQLRNIASQVLRCPPEELDVGNSKVYMIGEPNTHVKFEDLAHGYKYDNGNSIGGQLIARGTFIMTQLTDLDPNTGKGKTGPGYTVGCQAVEIEYDPNNYAYQVVHAVTAIDLGHVINPKNARSILTGGMCMGLGLATREELAFNTEGAVLNPQLRTYKLMRFGEQPKYSIAFVETPQLDSPYGERGIGEHGIVGIPAAVANALSAATGTEMDHIPLTPEAIWRTTTGGQV